jgi:hypothetical protein
VNKERLIIESMFRIPNKDGEDVDFLLNDEQALFIESMTGRDIVAKARQLGFSTLIIAIFLARCLMHRNRKCVIISHSTDASQKLLTRVNYMIKHMKGALPELKNQNQNFLTFPKMDSSIYIGTAGSGDFGVGDTITDLLCSEVSRWVHPGPLLSGLFQAVPKSGNIVIESTGRGTGNWFHRTTMRSVASGGYKVHFFSWTNRPEYKMPAPADFMSTLDEALEEPECAQLGLTPEQLFWRRQKIIELDGDLQQFKEQYPLVLAECFQSTGNSFFTKLPYVPMPSWKRRDAWTMILGDHPKIGHTYAAGADPAGGVGGDSAVLEIYDIETGEQVCEYANNRIEADLFALKCADMCHLFNGAMLNFERNNHGILFASEIIKHYPISRIYSAPSPKRSARNVAARSEIRKLADYGTYTSEVSKNLMLGRLKRAFREGEIVIYSSKLHLECTTFVESDSGSLGAEAGCHDDCVMASAFAVAMFAKAASDRDSAKAERDSMRGLTTAETFNVGRLLHELETRYKQRQDDGLPISTGVSEHEDIDNLGYW